PLEAWTEYARLLIARNRQQEQPNWEEVDDALSHAARLARDPRQAVDVTLLRAEMLGARREYDQAQLFLQGEAEAHPDRVDLWLARVALAEERGQVDQASRLLDLAARQFKDRVEPRLSRARFWLNQHGAAASRKLTELADGLERFEPEQQSNLLRGLAEASY